MERGNRILWTLLQAFLPGTIRQTMMQGGRKSAICSSFHVASMYSHSHLMLAMQGFLFAAIVVVYRQVHKKNGTLSAAKVLASVCSTIKIALLYILPRWKAEKTVYQMRRKSFVRFL